MAENQGYSEDLKRRIVEMALDQGIPVLRICNGMGGVLRRRTIIKWIEQERKRRADARQAEADSA